MVWVKTYQSEAAMGLEEFMQHAERTDMKCPDALFALGEQLSLLGNNREFLSRFMADLIKSTKSFDRLNDFVPQSIVLGRRKEFYVRANVWLPEAEITASEARLFAYFQPHDHNFDLLTYAYCGSGYETHIFEYDYSRVVGYLDEMVKVKPLGSYTHACGDIMMYRCSQDIHAQFPPKTPSITLNVIPLHTQGSLRDQYFFGLNEVDQEEAPLTKYVQTPIDSRRKVFDMIGMLGDDNLTDIVTDFALSHQCRRTRYHALQALAKINPTEHADVCNRLAGDPTPLIQQYLLTAEA